MPKIAVVIPARNAENTLCGTLASIACGSRRPDELFVVDGCSNDATRQIAQSFGAQVLANSKQHAAAARQLGVATATSQVIAFTDADCVVDASWLEQIAFRFESDPKLDGVGGRVLLSEPVNTLQRCASESFSSIMQFPHEAIMVNSRQMRGAFAESNCAYRKEAIVSVGGYKDFFSNYAEGIDLFWRMIASGRRLLFDPEVAVEHLGYPRSLQELVRTHFRYGIASTKLAKVHIGRIQIDKALHRRMVSALANTVIRPSSPEQWFNLCQLVAFFSGKVASSLRYGVINL